MSSKTQPIYIDKDTHRIIKSESALEGVPMGLYLQRLIHNQKKRVETGGCPRCGNPLKE